MYEKTWPRFFLVLLLTALMGGYFYYKKKKLDQCHYDGMAVIYDIKKYDSVKQKTDKGYFINYQYEVEGQIYKSSEGMGYSKMSVADYSIGDSIQIIIGCKDPSLVDMKKKRGDEER